MERHFCSNINCKYKCPKFRSAAWSDADAQSHASLRHDQTANVGLPFECGNSLIARKDTSSQGSSAVALDLPSGCSPDDDKFGGMKWTEGGQTFARGCARKSTSLEKRMVRQGRKRDRARLACLTADRLCKNHCDDTTWW